MPDWEEIAGLAPSTAVPENCFTRKEYCNKFNIAERTGMRTLDNLVLEGKLKVAKARVDGHLAKVYWRA